MSTRLSALAYLAAFERALPIEGGLAFAERLRAARLDYSIDSLDRIDRLLGEIHATHRPTAERFFADNASSNFVSLLAFYVGELIGRAYICEPVWSSDAEERERNPQRAPLGQGLICYLITTRPTQREDVFFPFNSLCAQLFDGDTGKSLRFVAGLFIRTEGLSPDEAARPLPPRGARQLTLDDQLAAIARAPADLRQQTLMGRPPWADGDPLAFLFRNDEQLIRRGRVVHGALVQANNDLFEPVYRGGEPGEVLYDPMNRLWPEDLASIAGHVYTLKDRRLEDPALRAIAGHLEAGTSRVFGLDVPPAVLPYPLKLSSTYFDQRHLPDGMISLRSFPIVICDAIPGAVKILPWQLWPPKMVEEWMSASTQRHGRRVTIAELMQAASRKAAQHTPHDLYEQGLLHYHGRGVAKDQARARVLWQQAADQGHAEAMNNLGVMYDAGDGVPVDFALAFKWYRAAADRGLALGRLNVGKMYLRGDAVERDEVRARAWLRRAAEDGNAEAQQLLSQYFGEQAPRGKPPVH
jgi:Sel1 repeat